MSDPVLTSNTYGNIFLYYTCDRDPTSSEPLVYNNMNDLVMFWWNTTTKNLFWCTDNTSDAMVWRMDVDSGNLSSSLASLGISSGAWTQSFTNLAFNTSRTPSATRNVTVIASFSQSSTVLTAAVVNAQLFINSVWTTVGTASLSGLLTSQVNSITFDVPMNTQYRFVSASGSNTISTIFETFK